MVRSEEQNNKLVARLIARFRSEHGDQYDYSKVTINPNDSKYWHSHIEVYCPRHEHHFTPTPSTHLHQGTCCKYCSREKSAKATRDRAVRKNGSLEATHPHIAAEWDFEKNKPLLPSDISYGSPEEVQWICPNGHPYPARVDHRTISGSSCPDCKGQTSRSELRLLAELSYIFEGLRHREKIKPGNLEVDICFPEGNLAVEYDGVFYHQKRHSADKRKNALLFEQGIKVIRVREQGLQAIESFDVICEKDYLQKCDVDALLERLEASIIPLPELIKDRIESYKLSNAFLADERYEDFISRLPLGPQEKPISETHPLAAAIWDEDKNLPLRIDKFTYGSNQSIWWTCGEGHSRQRPINQKLKKDGRIVPCTICSGEEPSVLFNLGSEFPETLEIFDYKENEKAPEQLLPHSDQIVWWLCKKEGHSYDMSVGAVTRAMKKGKHKCPVCIGSRVTEENSFESVYPEFSHFWDLEKNVVKPSEVYCRATKEYFWKCPEGHPDSASPQHFVKRKHKCKKCGNREASPTYSLASEFPEIAPFWSDEKNGYPAKYELPRSNKVRWWVCAEGHEYPKPTNKRVELSPNYCQVCESLSYQEPMVVKDWDYFLNEGRHSPDDLKPTSTIKVWWTCEKGHALFEGVLNRVNKKYCDICERRIASPEYNLITEKPDLLNAWDLAGNGELLPWKFLPNSGKTVSWICANGHSYTNNIQTMFKRKNDVRFCSDHAPSGSAFIKRSSEQ